MPLFRFVLRAFFLTCLFAKAFAATWPITLDGKAEDAQWFSLSETPDKLAVGDVLVIAGVEVLVRDTNNLNFINALSSKAKLFRILPSGRRETIAFCPNRFDGKRPPKFKNLSQKEIEALWSVEIDEESGNKVSFVRGENTFVYIKYSSWKKTPIVLPETPLRAVNVDWDAEPDEHFNALFSKSTLYAFIDVINHKSKVKCEGLLRCENLKWLCLRIGADELDAPDTLAQFRDLRYLYWPWGGLKTCAFMEGMKDLREAYIAGNGIAEITPLVALPELRILALQMSPLADLPSDGFHRLSKLSLFGTEVSAQMVESFRKRHPQCDVQYEWLAELRRAVSNVDRFVVRTGGTCHRQYKKEKTIFESRNRSEIAELASLIVIDEKNSDGACMCCGSPTMEFYENGKLVAMIGIHHGTALRWSAWPADAVLSKESVKHFTEWLMSRGVKEPTEAIERAREQRAMIEAAIKAQKKE